MGVSRTSAQFSDKIDKRGTQLLKGLSKIHQQVVINAIRTLYEATPKDTTLAASSWFASVDAPDGTKPEVPVGKSTVVDRAKIAVKRSLGDRKIFLSNNQHYIRLLNDGSSSQAPAGFVQRAFLAGVLATDKLKIFLKG